jgi:hypothetical protein
MDRYYLARHESGGWNVIDRLIGGPVEIAGVLLYDLEADDADDLVDLLTRQDQQVLARLHEITKRRETP